MAFLPQAFERLANELDPAHDRLEILVDHVMSEIHALSDKKRRKICLKLSARFLEEAAYAVVNDGTTHSAVQLFSIAATLENEIERLTPPAK